MPPCRCNYPSCSGILPDTLLEKCGSQGCQNKLHHLCQVAFEESQNFDNALMKKCYLCLLNVLSTSFQTSVTRANTVVDKAVGTAQGTHDGNLNGAVGTKNASHDNSTTNCTNRTKGTASSGTAPATLVTTLPKVLNTTAPRVNDNSGAQGTGNGDENSSDESTATENTANDSTANHANDSTTNQQKANDGNNNDTNADNVPIRPPKQTGLPPQTSFVRCSGIFSPHIFLYDMLAVGKGTSVVSAFTEDDGPFAYGKIVSVPSNKKGITTYNISYDHVYNSKKKGAVMLYSEAVPNCKIIKKYLKEGIHRADQYGYRFSADKVKQRRRRQKQTKDGNEAIPNTNNVLLSGILQESMERKEDEVAEIENDAVSDSDDGTECDMEDSAFVTTEVADGESADVFDMQLVDDNDETDFMGGQWAWNNWKPLDIDDAVPGPQYSDHYNGPHGLKPGIEHTFKTVLQCMFSTTAMDRFFFKRLAAQSNRYAPSVMRSRNTSLYLGHPWKNITVGEMV